MTLGDYRMMPRATFCPPQVACFGLTEEQAREEGYDVKVAKFPFTANGKAHGLGEPVGFVKLIADAKYGELLGGHLIGPDVSELLPELTLAQKWDLTALEAGPQRAHAPDPVGGAAGSLPRPGRPHDQLLIGASCRPGPLCVAAVGGLVIGHMLWLLAITLAINTSEVSFWVLITSAVITVLSVGRQPGLGWRAYQRKDQVWTAFLWSVPVAPMLLTLVVLGVTYL